MIRFENSSKAIAWASYLFAVVSDAFSRSAEGSDSQRGSSPTRGGSSSTANIGVKARDVRHSEMRELSREIGELWCGRWLVC